MDQLTDYIGRGLSKKLEGYRLIATRSKLIRQFSEGWQAIAIEALTRSDSEVAKLAAHAQVRLDVIENCYTPFHPFLSSRDAKVHPTLTINCDQLLSSSELIHGFVTDKGNVDKFVDDYAEALKSNVLPWLAKYSNEEEIFLNLNDDNPKRWVTSDRLCRFPVLLAILARRKDWQRFDQVAKDFAEYCESPHARVYIPLVISVVSGLKHEYRKC